MITKHFNKKGSMMLLLMIVIGILTILGTVILSVSISNYKMKLTNSRVKKNFYISDSGIEIAEYIIKNVIKDAVEAGDDAAYEYLINLDLEREIEDEELRIDSPYINDDGTINTEYIEREQNEIFKKTYKDYIKKNIVNRIEEVRPKEGRDSINIEPTISAFYNEENLLLNIISEYQENNIAKMISCEYKLVVPDYGIEVKPEEIGEIAEISKNHIWEKAIASDGKLTLNEDNLVVFGDVFVKGKNNLGICITQKGTNLTFNGKVTTLGDLKIDSNSVSQKNLNVIGDVCADNIRITSNSNNANIYVEGNAFTSDDLELNGSKSKIEINGGYYGVSDGSSAEGNKPDNSSSIIINSEDLGSGQVNSQLIINEEIIILGSSYIKAYKRVGDELIPYQTGESLSMKGKYIAYTKSLTKKPEEEEDKVLFNKLKEDNVRFEYYDPLVLVDSFINGNPLNVEDKSEYFRLYFLESGDEELEVLRSGLILPNNTDKIHSIGAVITNDNILTGRYNIGIEEYIESLFNSTFLDMVRYNPAIKNIEQVTSVNTQVDLDFITNSMEEMDVDNIYLSRNSDYVINHSNNNKNIVITGGNVTIEDTNFDGIIISGGNVYINGNVNISGVVIAVEDIIVSQTGNKIVKYDKEKVIRLIGKNIYLFENIFINNTTDKIYIIILNDSLELEDNQVSITELYSLIKWNQDK